MSLQASGRQSEVLALSRGRGGRRREGATQNQITLSSFLRREIACCGRGT